MGCRYVICYFGGVARKLLIAIHQYHVCDLLCSYLTTIVVVRAAFPSIFSVSAVVSGNTFPHSELCKQLC